MIFLILPLLAAVLLFPYGWAVFHRYRLLKRLTVKGKQLGFALKTLRRGAMFSHNRSVRYDFCLEGRDRIYLVKLWACYRRGTTLLVDEGGRVAVRSRYPLPIQKEEGMESIEEVVNGRFRSVPRTEAPRLEAKGKRVIPVLLCYPTYDAAFRKIRGKILPIRNGDVLFEKKFYTPSALERAMKQENPS